MYWGASRELFKICEGRRITVDLLGLELSDGITQKQKNLIGYKIREEGVVLIGIEYSFMTINTTGCEQGVCLRMVVMKYFLWQPYQRPDPSWPTARLRSILLSIHTNH